MSQSSVKIFRTPKSSKITQITNVTRGISSKVLVKTSICSPTRYSWLAIVISLIAIAGILGTVGIALVLFVFLRSTISSTSTTTVTTSTLTTTSTATRRFTISSPIPSNVWLPVAFMTVARVYHSSTLISQDNSVLIAGGSNGITISLSVQEYIPLTVDQLPSLSSYVLIAGGYDVAGTSINSADLYLPITNDIVTISLSAPRYRHTSTMLSSSQLVLIGGYSTGGVMLDSSDMIDTALNSSFASSTNNMTQTHVYHTATLLGNNSDVVLIAGGFQTTGYISAAYLYHGPSNAFISFGSGVTMSPARCYHTAIYLPPPIHKVLLVSGADSFTIYGTMFLFDVASLAFATLTSTLIYPRYLHTATLLPNGKILITGGFNGGTLRTCELIDPLNNYTAIVNTCELYFV